jgi:hypothetical protein
VLAHQCVNENVNIKINQFARSIAAIMKRNQKSKRNKCQSKEAWRSGSMLKRYADRSLPSFAYGGGSDAVAVAFKIIAVAMKAAGSGTVVNKLWAMKKSNY